MALASAALSLTGNLMVVAVTQVVLVLLAVALSIHVARLLHDAVPSSVRAGVASGVGAFSWIAFLPFALAFGLVSRNLGRRHRGLDDHRCGRPGRLMLVVDSIVGRRPPATSPIGAVGALRPSRPVG